MQYGKQQFTIRQYTKWVYTIPAPSSTNKTTTGMFIDEMTDLLIDNIPKYWNLIILGDFSISTENVSNPDTVIFSDTMAALGLQQHVQGPTHKMGNTLDLIFSQLKMQITVTATATYGFVLDHCMVINRTVTKDASTANSKKGNQRLLQSYTTELHWKLHNTKLQSQHNTGWRLPPISKRNWSKGLNQMTPLKTYQMQWQTETPMGQCKFIKEQERVVKNREKT